MKVTIDRELLARWETDIQCGVISQRAVLEGIRAILAAPRQPEGEGLTRYGLGIVGGIAAFVSADDGCMVLYEDHQRIADDFIVELDLANARNMTLRQQLAERDAEILEQCRLNGMGAERELKLIAQGDKLAGLLRRVLSTHDYHTDDGAQAADEAHAALAEVDK